MNLFSPYGLKYYVKNKHLLVNQLTFNNPIKVFLRLRNPWFQFKHTQLKSKAECLLLKKQF